MSSFVRVALFLCVLALVAPFSPAADFEPDTDGPWINVDVIDLADYGDATYLEYLGMGYVAMLDALKSEGLITKRRASAWVGWRRRSTQTRSGKKSGRSSRKCGPSRARISTVAFFGISLESSVSFETGCSSTRFPRGARHADMMLLAALRPR